MEKFTPNKWIVIGILALMLVILLPVSILMIGTAEPTDPNSGDNVLNQPTTSVTTVPSNSTPAPTPVPTTAPTTVPTTVPVVPPSTVKPPVVSTKPPVTTTKPPVVTTTKPPVVTTTKPPVTNPPTPSFDVNGTFKIAENGQAKAAIVIDYNCSDKEWTAAADLKSYLDRMTGVQIPIVYDSETLANDKFYICVGDTTYGNAKGVAQPKGYPNNEKLVIKRVENFMIIVGNDDGCFTGTEFAVTRFLEELGCGWFGIGDLWTVVPSKPNLTVGNLNITETPKFISRQSRLQNGSTYELSKRWYMGGVETLVGQHYLMALVGNGHQSAHPEWYARKSNGSQLYPVGNQGAWPDAYWQFCYSNAGLQQYVAQVVTDYFDKNPNCYVFAITPNDGWHFKTCQCSGCNAFGNETEYILNFANKVAAITKTKYPDRRVSVLTYHPTMPAPPRSYPVESNVEIMFCMENHMMKRASASNNYYYVSGSSQGVSWASNFQTYSSRTGVKHKAVWKWLCIAANDGDRANWQYMPWVQGNVATDDHDYWKQNGVEYVFYDQGPLNGYKEYASSTPLRWPLWYVAQRGSWTQGKNGQQLLAEACQKLYGNGANAMLAYYMALADASAAAGGTSYAWYPPKASEVYTSSWRSTIDAKVSAVEGMYGSVTADQKARMQNQVQLWKTAKSKI